LHANGQSTHETVQAAERLGTELGLRATLILRWEEIELRAADSSGTQVSFERGSPTSINMHRVGLAMSTTEKFAAGAPTIGAALENIKLIAHSPPAPTWLFTLAAAGVRLRHIDTIIESEASKGTDGGQEDERSKAGAHGYWGPGGALPGAGVASGAQGIDRENCQMAQEVPDCPGMLAHAGWTA
jgi:hypothetical protein